MRIDSSAVLGATFQRCRWVRRRHGHDKDLGEVLALVDAILSEVDQQGTVLIDVPEGWVPQKWVSAVQGDTQRNMKYRQAMQPSDNDVRMPEKRRQILLLQLLVRELQRLWERGDTFTVSRIGSAFHNTNLRMLGSAPESSMDMFRVICADWDSLSMDMREGCCRVMGLERQKAEELINTRGFAVNCSGPRRFNIKRLPLMGSSRC